MGSSVRHRPSPASGESRVSGHKTVDHAHERLAPGWHFGSYKRGPMTRGSDHCEQFASRMKTMGSPNNEKMLTDMRAGSRNTSRKT